VIDSFLSMEGTREQGRGVQNDVERQGAVRVVEHTRDEGRGGEGVQTNVHGGVRTARVAASEKGQPTRLDPESQYGVYNPYSRNRTVAWREQYAAGAARYWDAFYKRHKHKFFKHRRWLLKEFECELVERKPLTMLEVGCGVGDTVFPLLEAVDGLFVHCCDFSPTAVSCLLNSAEYDERRCHAFVHDLVMGTPETLSSALGQGVSVDLVSAIFVLSAIAPEHHRAAVHALHGVLRVGGRILFRDYCAGDLSQVRYDAHGQALPSDIDLGESGRGGGGCDGGDDVGGSTGTPHVQKGDGMYVRQDGTATHYFTPDGLARLFCEGGLFKVVRQRVVNKVIHNRKERASMARVWIQAVFEKQQ